MKKRVLAVAALAVLTGCAAAPESAVHNRAEALKQIRAAEETAIRAFGKRDGDLVGVDVCAGCDFDADECAGGKGRGHKTSPQGDDG